MIAEIVTMLAGVAFAALGLSGKSFTQADVLYGFWGGMLFAEGIHGVLRVWYSA